MIDLNNLPKNIDKQIFNAANGGTWQSWTKPSGASTAYIVCIGGGGGGGGGANRPSPMLACGGGGGSSSAVTIAQVAFYSIPDTLYIQVGLGGLGGATTTNGNNGELSYVSCYPSTNMSDCLLVNSLAPSNFGRNGTNTAFTGIGGAAPAALLSSSTNNPRYLSLCNWVSYSGQAGGSAAGQTGNSPDITLLGGLIVTGGTGGGTTTLGNGAGSAGNILSADTLASFLKTNSGGSAGSFVVLLPGNGKNGYDIKKPFMFVGGTGGGSTNSYPPSFGTNPGGNGANGNIGCGGGGGGAGYVGGKGGNGGNGLVMIISY
jgi:hypothetical protein